MEPIRHFEISWPLAENDSKWRTDPIFSFFCRCWKIQKSAKYTFTSIANYQICKHYHIFLINDFCIIWQKSCFLVWHFHEKTCFLLRMGIERLRDNDLGKVCAGVDYLGESPSVKLQQQSLLIPLHWYTLARISSNLSKKI